MSHGFEHIDRVVTTLPDGRTMAKGVTTQVVAAGNAYITVTIPHLRHIEEVIHIEGHFNPETLYTSVGQKNVDANSVGVTIYDLLASTTLTLEVIAIGM